MAQPSTPGQTVRPMNPSATASGSVAMAAAAEIDYLRQEVAPDAEHH